MLLASIDPFVQEFDQLAQRVFGWGETARTPRKIEIHNADGQKAIKKSRAGVSLGVSLRLSGRWDWDRSGDPARQRVADALAR